MNYEKMTKDYELIIKLNKVFENEIEIFRPIQNYSNYSASTYGNIRNNTTNKILKPRLNKKNGYYYIQLWKNGKSINRSLQRIIANTFMTNPDNKRCVDHIDRNKANNNVNNLRFATHTENNINKTTFKNTSGYVGVSWSKQNKKWQAQIGINGKNKHLGFFDKASDASTARINAEIECFGEFRKQ